jgi:IS30 family transposase
MKRTYHYLSHMDWATLMLMRDQGYSLRAIGTKLRRAPSTLSRELRRHTGEGRAYDAGQAVERAKPSKGPAQLEPVAAPDAN